MPTHHLRVPSPLGEILLLADDAALIGLLLPEDPPAESAGSPDLGASAPAHPVLALARGQLDEYFAGRRRTFDVPLHLPGTDFQRAVWDALLRLPYGATTSYGALAAQIRRPRAVRAVGSANGRNPVAILVPCHRVIGSDGGLRGYAYGEAKKRWLLDHERAFA